MSFLFNDVKIPNVGREILLFTFSIFFKKRYLALLSLQSVCMDVIFTLAYVRNVKRRLCNMTRQVVITI